MTKIIQPLTPDNTFFVSDTHFGHAGIIRMCNRPYTDIDEMDAALIENWNRVVPEDAHIFHLGDVSWYRNAAKNLFLLRQLNGIKYLLLGNHDKPMKDCTNIFQWQRDYMRIAIMDGDKQIDVALFHYPIASWDKQFHGSYHLFGHTHNMYFPPQKNTMEVGVDNPLMNYSPKSFRDILEILNPAE